MSFTYCLACFSFTCSSGAFFAWNEKHKGQSRHSPQPYGISGQPISFLLTYILSSSYATVSLYPPPQFQHLKTDIALLIWLPPVFWECYVSLSVIDTGQTTGHAYSIGKRTLRSNWNIAHLYTGFPFLRGDKHLLSETSAEHSWINFDAFIVELPCSI